MITITHIITALTTGGAEMMLYKLLAHTDRDRFKARVYCLSAETGPVADMIEAFGVPVRVLGMSREAPNPLDALRLRGWIRDERPQLIQTWMYHADLVGGVAAKLVDRRLPVIWNIRHSTLDPEHSRGRTIQVARICAKLSAWLPETIVCCSAAARLVHAAIGYEDRKITVIPNGFDLASFRPDPSARVEVRRELGLGQATPLIGLAARFDPQKDHRTFLEAASRLRSRVPDVHFLLCGLGITADNAELGHLIDAAGVRPACHLLGERGDMPRLAAALDIQTVSSAFGEAFPNVLGEAMACAVPCVTTDVGDSAYIVGETGYVVPTRNPGALADAWYSLLSLGPEELQSLGREARRRVEAHFDIRGVVRAYEETYRAVTETCERRQKW